MSDEPIDFDAEDPEPVHSLFGLSYANYLVLHRTLMQSMPVEWQRRMVACVAQLDAAFDHIERPAFFDVVMCDVDGRPMRDPVPNYERGRTRVEPHLPAGVSDDPT